MQVEWDSNKAYINFQKHGIRFSDAEAVLYDRGDRVRLISARPATSSERRNYENGI